MSFRPAAGSKACSSAKRCAKSTGVAALFEATDARIDEAFERISSVERRLRRLEAAAQWRSGP